MRISCNWLKRHVDLTDIDLVSLGRRFTMSVAELDEIEHVGSGLDRVVIGFVLDVQGLEGKKVRLTSVDCGVHGTLAIICGAPNVSAGQHVAIALPGQRLGDMTIEVADVAGITSHGMICSEKELGLSDESAGILVLNPAEFQGGLVLGTRLDAVLDVSDTIFVIDNKSLTHRPDCWGHRGIAREVAALIVRPLKPLDLDVPFTDAAPITITVEVPADCPRYCAVSLTGVSVAPSPLWLRLMLARTGMRAINNIIDATNFVMLDVGNPLHAFDARALAGGRIGVRRATAGEVFTTLDGTDRPLTADDVVITDGEKATALAGIMGGLHSEIRQDTTSLILEAANFDPARVRTTSQRLGLRTESSARFEKSLDPRLPLDAARSFCVLLKKLFPALEVRSALQDVAQFFAAPTIIETSFDYIRERLGYAVSSGHITQILENLDFTLENDGTEDVRITVPSYRATKDISIREDIVEEVGRVFGYDNIPPEAPSVVLTRPEANTRKRFERTTRHHLAIGAGLDEIQSYSFDDEMFVTRLGLAPGVREALKNPMSAEMPFMRRTIDSHLLMAIEKNARNFTDISIFEIGRVFIPSDAELPEQPTMLGVALAGAPAFIKSSDGSIDKSRTDASWFMRLKGVLGGLSLALERGALRLERGGVAHTWAHPARQAVIYCGDVAIGHLAEIHPLTIKHLDISQHGALAEINLDLWRSLPVVAKRYHPLPRFPAVYRDFAMVVERSVQASALEAAIRGAAPDLIEEVTFQSVFEGGGVPEGMKSLAWSVTLRRPERTLQEADIHQAEEAIWQKALRDVGARPRS